MNIQNDYSSNNEQKSFRLNLKKIPKRKNTLISKADELINIEGSKNSEIKSVNKNEETDDIVHFNNEDYEANRFKHNVTKTTKDDSEDFIK